MANPFIKQARKIAVKEMETVLLLIVLSILVLLFVPAARQYAEIILAFLGLVVLIQLLRALGIIVEVKEYERLVIFRMGHFHRIAGPGWVIVLPLLEEAKKVDLRVQRFDLPAQEVITADEIRVAIDTIVYYRIKDPAKAVLKVKEFQETVAGYVYAALRDIAGNLTLNELYSEIEKVNDIVKVKVEPLTADWGIDIIDVEVESIRIPEPIQQAMHMRRRAKEEWAAAQYQARAQQAIIEAIAQAASKLNDKALAYLYIKETLPKIASGPSTKLVFPTVFPMLPEGMKEATNETMKIGWASLAFKGEGKEGEKKEEGKEEKKG